MNGHRLIVLRHAQAASPLGTPDVERPLTDRGRRDARAAGKELRAAGSLPDHVVCSTALRTRQTYEELALEAPVEFDSRVYRNRVDLLLELLGEQDARTLLLIGHSPSVHELVLALTEAPDEGFPTAAMAVIDLDAGRMSGRLATFWRP